MLDTIKLIDKLDIDTLTIEEINMLRDFYDIEYKVIKLLHEKGVIKKVSNSPAQYEERL